MKKRREVLTEVVCPACDGTGFQKVGQPSEPARKIYPANVSAQAEQTNRGKQSARHLGTLIHTCRMQELPRAGVAIPPGNFRSRG
jgi:hypothetical protein